MPFKVIPPGDPMQPGVVAGFRCPACRQLGTLQPLAAQDVHGGGSGVVLGQRVCPNPSCRTHVFIVLRGDKLVESYPPEKLDFDTTDLPVPIVSALEEAVTCHANGCFVAAAIMVRKTLEELCMDRQATGATLKTRLQALGSKVILPPELFAGLDDIRLLGNDAAHIESQAYHQVGEQEVHVAIRVTKEVLKAVYQYSSLLAELKSLKKP